MEQKFNKELINQLKKKYTQTQEQVKRTRMPVMRLASGGSITVRIMTFEHEGVSHIYHEDTLHFLGKVPFRCGKIERNSCILCTLADWYKDAGNKKFSNRIRAGTRYFINAVDVTSGDLVVLSLNLSTFNNLLSYFADEEYRPYLLGKKARNIKIERQGEELDTEYHLRIGMKDVEIDAFPEPIDFIDHYSNYSDEELLKQAMDAIDIPSEFLNDINTDDFGDGPKPKKKSNREKMKETSGEPDDEFPPEPDDDGNVAEEDAEFPDEDAEFPDEEEEEPDEEEEKPKKSKPKDDDEFAGMNPKLAETLKKLRTNK